MKAATINQKLDFMTTPNNSWPIRTAAIAAIIARNAPLGIQVTKEAARKYVEHGEQAL